MNFEFKLQVVVLILNTHFWPKSIALWESLDYDREKRYLTSFNKCNFDFVFLFQGQVLLRGILRPRCRKSREDNLINDEQEKLYKQTCDVIFWFNWNQSVAIFVSRRRRRHIFTFFCQNWKKSRVCFCFCLSFSFFHLQNSKRWAFSKILWWDSSEKCSVVLLTTTMKPLLRMKRVVLLMLLLLLQVCAGLKLEAGERLRGVGWGLASWLDRLWRSRWKKTWGMGQNGFCWDHNHRFFAREEVVGSSPSPHFFFKMFQF